VNSFSTRAGFDALKNGNLPGGGLPYLGVFTPGHMSYEVCVVSFAVVMYSEIFLERQVDREAAKEPSLLEMAKTALNSLKKATEHTEKGFFIVRFFVAPALHKS